MPPHLHRRPSLRQSMSSRRRALLLPPHKPQAHHRSSPSPLPPLRLRSATARGSLRHSILHRPGPSAHSIQRYRLPARRTPALRPPDREPQPAPRSRFHSRGQHRRRDRPRSRFRPTRSTRRGRSNQHGPQFRRHSPRKPGYNPRRRNTAIRPPDSPGLRLDPANRVESAHPNQSFDVSPAQAQSYLRPHD